MNTRMILTATAALSLLAGSALAGPLPNATARNSAAVPASATAPVPAPKPADPAVAEPAIAAVDAKPVVADASEQAGTVKPVRVYWFLSGR